MGSRNYVIYTIIGLIVIAGISYAINESLNPSVGQEVFLSTTTSVQNTGLLDYLIEHFEKSHDIDVKYTAVGSGAAVQLARDGEVDAVLVHAPDLEQGLLDDHYADKRNTLWFNYFIIVGPSSDPAGISNATSAAQAFDLIYDAGTQGQATFYSRGDHSGTHIKELGIWSNSSHSPPFDSGWYKELDTGMSATLTTANNDPQGYTLTDLGTFAKLQGSQTPLDMVELYGHDNQLYNPYSYLIINSATTGTTLNTAGAQKFLDFLKDPATDALVRNYKVGGIVLFTPIATQT